MGCPRSPKSCDTQNGCLPQGEGKRGEKPSLLRPPGPCWVNQDGVKRRRVSEAADGVWGLGCHGYVRGPSAPAVLPTQAPCDLSPPATGRKPTCISCQTCEFFSLKFLPQGMPPPGERPSRVCQPRRPVPGVQVLISFLKKFQQRVNAHP